MRKHTEIIKAADELYSSLTQSLNTFAEVSKTKIESLTTASYDDAHTVVAEICESICALIAGCTSEDKVIFPKFLSSFKTYETDGKLSDVSVTIKSKLKDVVKYKKEVKLSVDANFITELFRFYTDAIFEMYYRNEANNNLTEVNEFINKICVENNIPYTFGFALSDKKEYITYIDNDKVIFNADVTEALGVSKHGLFLSGDSYFDFVREQQVEKLVKILSATQTTPQLLKANIDIINTLVGYKTKKRADKLIRNTYHKKAEYFDGLKKGGFGYFETKINDTDVFSILEKNADGTISVVLNPFDIKTLCTVDVDIIAELKKVAEA